MRTFFCTLVLATMLATAPTALGQGKTPPKPSALPTPDVIESPATDADIAQFKAQIKALETTVDAQNKTLAKLLQEPQLKKDLKASQEKVAAATKELKTTKELLDKTVTRLAAAEKFLAQVKRQPDLPRDYTGLVKFKGSKDYTAVKTDDLFLWEGVWHCYSSADNILYYQSSAAPLRYRKK